MESDNELITQRREKLEALRARGVNPFGTAFETSGSIAELREKFKDGEVLRAAGRITAHRDMGKSKFVDLRDASGRLQIYFHEKEIGPEAKAAVPHLMPLLSEKDANLRSAAGEALGQIGPDAKSAVLALTAALEDSQAFSNRAHIW